LEGEHMKKRELVIERWCNETSRIREHTLENLKMEDMLRMDSDGIRKAITSMFSFQTARAWIDSGMQVYEFDSDFSESILNEKWVDLLPDCIGNRPYDCFYMKIPGIAGNEGVVVHVISTDKILGFNSEFFPGAEEAKGVYFGGDPDWEDRVLVNTGSELLSLTSLSVPDSEGEMRSDVLSKQIDPDIVANGVAYICSKNADIVPSYKPNGKLKRNNAKRRSYATWHDVGYRIGSELRAYERVKFERKQHQGGTKRPHMRRAHWHHYWTGPRDGDRELVLKWLAPTMVSVSNGDIESATGHRVR